MDMHRLRVVGFDTSLSGGDGKISVAELEESKYEEKKAVPPGCQEGETKEVRVNRQCLVDDATQPGSSFTRKSKSEELKVPSKSALKNKGAKNNSSLEDITQPVRNGSRSSQRKRLLKIFNRKPSSNRRSPRNRKTSAVRQTTEQQGMKEQNIGNNNNAEVKVLFSRETPSFIRHSRSRKRNNTGTRRSRESDSQQDVFGFKKNRLAVPYQYQMSCHYLNIDKLPFKKLRKGLHQKQTVNKVTNVPQPVKVDRYKHHAMRILDSGFRCSVENETSTKPQTKPSTVYYNLSTHSQRTPKFLRQDITVNQNRDENVAVKSESLLSLNKCCCDAGCGPSKTVVDTSSRHPPTTNEDEPSVECKPCLHHQKPQSIPCPNSSGKRSRQGPCCKRKNKKNGERGRKCKYGVLSGFWQNMTTFPAKSGTPGKNCIKYAFFGLLFVVWSPCMLAVVLAWIILCPVRLTDALTKRKSKKTIPFVTSFMKRFGKTYTPSEYQRMCLNRGPFKKNKSLMSSVASWYTRTARTFVNSVNTVLSTLKIKNSTPSYFGSSFVPRRPRPNPKKRYTLFYADNRGWMMKPVRHRNVRSSNRIVQNMRCEGNPKLWTNQNIPSDVGGEKNPLGRQGQQYSPIGDGTTDLPNKAKDPSPSYSGVRHWSSARKTSPVMYAQPQFKQVNIPQKHVCSLNYRCNIEQYPNINAANYNKVIQVPNFGVYPPVGLQYLPNYRNNLGSHAVNSNPNDFRFLHHTDKFKNGTQPFGMMLGYPCGGKHPVVTNKKAFKAHDIGLAGKKLNLSQKCDVHLKSLLKQSFKKGKTSIIHSKIDKDKEVSTHKKVLRQLNNIHGNKPNMSHEHESITKEKALNRPCNPKWVPNGADRKSNNTHRSTWKTHSIRKEPVRMRNRRISAHLSHCVLTKNENTSTCNIYCENKSQNVSNHPKDKADHLANKSQYLAKKMQPQKLSSELKNSELSPMPVNSVYNTVKDNISLNCVCRGDLLCRCQCRATPNTNIRQFVSQKMSPIITSTKNQFTEPVRTSFESRTTSFTPDPIIFKNSEQIVMEVKYDQNEVESRSSPHKSYEKSHHDTMKKTSTPKHHDFNTRQTDHGDASTKASKVLETYKRQIYRDTVPENQAYLLNIKSVKNKLLGDDLCCCVSDEECVCEDEDEKKVIVPKKPDKYKKKVEKGIQPETKGNWFPNSFKGDRPKKEQVNTASGPDKEVILPKKVSPKQTKKAAPAKVAIVPKKPQLVPKKKVECGCGPEKEVILPKKVSPKQPNKAAPAKVISTSKKPQFVNVGYGPDEDCIISGKVECGCGPDKEVILPKKVSPKQPNKAAPAKVISTPTKPQLVHKGHGPDEDCIVVECGCGPDIPYEEPVVCTCKPEVTQTRPKKSMNIFKGRKQDKVLVNCGCGTGENTTKKVECGCNTKESIPKKVECGCNTKKSMKKICKSVKSKKKKSFFDQMINTERKEMAEFGGGTTPKVTRRKGVQKRPRVSEAATSLTPPSQKSQQTETIKIDWKNKMYSKFSDLSNILTPKSSKVECECLDKQKKSFKTKCKSPKAPKAVKVKDQSTATSDWINKMVKQQKQFLKTTFWSPKSSVECECGPEFRTICVKVKDQSTVSSDLVKVVKPQKKEKSPKVTKIIQAKSVPTKVNKVIQKTGKKQITVVQRPKIDVPCPCRSKGERKPCKRPKKMNKMTQKTDRKLKRARKHVLPNKSKKTCSTQMSALTQGSGFDFSSSQTVAKPEPQEMCHFLARTPTKYNVEDKQILYHRSHRITKTTDNAANLSYSQPTSEKQSYDDPSLQITTSTQYLPVSLKTERASQYDCNPCKHLPQTCQADDFSSEVWTRGRSAHESKLSHCCTRTRHRKQRREELKPMQKHYKSPQGPTKILQRPRKCTRRQVEPRICSCKSSCYNEVHVPHKVKCQHLNTSEKCHCWYTDCYGTRQKRAIDCKCSTKMQLKRRREYDPVPCDRYSHICAHQAYQVTSEKDSNEAVESATTDNTAQKMQSLHSPSQRLFEISRNRLQDAQKNEIGEHDSKTCKKCPLKQKGQLEQDTRSECKCLTQDLPKSSPQLQHNLYSKITGLKIHSEHSSSPQTQYSSFERSLRSNNNAKSIPVKSGHGCRCIDKRSSLLSSSARMTESPLIKRFSSQIHSFHSECSIAVKRLKNASVKALDGTRYKKQTSISNQPQTLIQNEDTSKFPCDCKNCHINTTKQEDSEAKQTNECNCAHTLPLKSPSQLPLNKSHQPSITSKLISKIFRRKTNNKKYFIDSYVSAAEFSNDINGSFGDINLLANIQQDNTSPRAYQSNPNICHLESNMRMQPKQIRDQRHPLQAQHTNCNCPVEKSLSSNIIVTNNTSHSSKTGITDKQLINKSNCPFTSIHPNYNQSSSFPTHTNCTCSDAPRNRKYSESSLISFPVRSKISSGFSNKISTSVTPKSQKDSIGNLRKLQHPAKAKKMPHRKCQCLGRKSKKEIKKEGKRNNANLKETQSKKFSEMIAQGTDAQPELLQHLLKQQHRCSQPRSRQQKYKIPPTTIGTDANLAKRGCSYPIKQRTHPDRYGKMQTYADDQPQIKKITRHPHRDHAFSKEFGTRLLSLSDKLRELGIITEYLQKSQVATNMQDGLSKTVTQQEITKQGKEATDAEFKSLHSQDYTHAQNQQQEVLKLDHAGTFTQLELPKMSEDVQMQTETHVKKKHKRIHLKQLERSRKIEQNELQRNFDAQFDPSKQMKSLNSQTWIRKIHPLAVYHMSYDSRRPNLNIDHQQKVSDFYRYDDTQQRSHTFKNQTLTDSWLHPPYADIYGKQQEFSPYLYNKEMGPSVKFQTDSKESAIASQNILIQRGEKKENRKQNKNPNKKNTKAKIPKRVKMDLPKQSERLPDFNRVKMRYPDNKSSPVAPKSPLPVAPDFSPTHFYQHTRPGGLPPPKRGLLPCFTNPLNPCGPIVCDDESALRRAYQRRPLVVPLPPKSIQQVKKEKEQERKRRANEIKQKKAAAKRAKKIQKEIIKKKKPKKNIYECITDAINDAEKGAWPTRVSCNPMYIHTLKKRPCWWVYECFPSCYPGFLNFLRCQKSFLKTLLFCFAICIWCPCLVCVYFCCTLICREG